MKKNNKNNINYNAVVAAVCVLACGVGAIGLYSVGKMKYDYEESRNNEKAYTVDSNKNAEYEIPNFKNNTEKSTVLDKTNKTDKENKEPLIKAPENKTIEKNKIENEIRNENQNENENNLYIPLKGEIIEPFSPKKPIYDKSLELYRTNDSLSISAKSGDEVRCIKDGTVKEIVKTPELYTSVTIESSDCSTTYSQLKDNPPVKVSQKINKGDILGYVGSPTKYTSALGSHLIIKMTNENGALNPEEYISIS